MRFPFPWLGLLLFACGATNKGRETSSSSVRLDVRESGLPSRSNDPEPNVASSREASHMQSPIGLPPSSDEARGVHDVEAPDPAAEAPSTPTSATPKAHHAVLAGGKDAGHSVLPDSGFPSPSIGISIPEGGEVAPKDKSKRKRPTRQELEDRDEQFKERMKQKRHRDLLFELRADGTYELREASLREVFSYVEECVAPYALSTVLSEKSPRAGSPRRKVEKYRAMGTHRNVSDEGGGRMLRSWSKDGGMFGKSLNLHLRDLRQLFSFRAKDEPAISVRRNCILVNFETLRGIILVDRILLVVDAGADSILMEVRKAFSDSAGDAYEFELKAVEALLLVSSKRLKREVHEVEGPISDIIQILEGPGRGATSAENNDRFRNLSNKLDVLESRAKARRRALLMVLEEDADLAMMNLTRMYQSPEDYVPPLAPDVLEDHEEMELLLEAYLQDINSIYNVLELHQGRARSTEAVVMVKLDIARNRILTAELVFSMFSASCTVGTLISGIFGMNLSSGVENDQDWFTWVAAGTVIWCALSFLSLFRFFYHHGILVT